jgi:hypothetical protein
METAIAKLPEDLVDRLAYASYAHNRRLFPSTSPMRWQAIYGTTVPAMEARFVLESKRSTTPESRAA